MYYLLGADQREYGPVGPDQLRTWIAEGRVAAATRVRRAEPPTDGRPLRDYPELAALLPPPPLPVVPNRLVPAVLVTVACCLPCGVVALIYSARVNRCLETGDPEGAARASRTAARWCLLSLGVGLLVKGLIAAVWLTVWMTSAAQSN